MQGKKFIPVPDTIEVIGNIHLCSTPYLRISLMLQWEYFTGKPSAVIHMSPGSRIHRVKCNLLKADAVFLPQQQQLTEDIPLCCALHCHYESENNFCLLLKRTVNEHEHFFSPTSLSLNKVFQIFLAVSVG